MARRSKGRLPGRTVNHDSVMEMNQDDDLRKRPDVEYDRPSSLFGQFGNSEINAVADMLDRKLEALVAKAIE
jgi:hypothetical protein